MEADSKISNSAIRELTGVREALSNLLFTDKFTSGRKMTND